MKALRTLAAVVVGFLAALLLLAIHTAVCSVPLLNVITCFGLGAPVLLEQVAVVFGLPIMAGHAAWNA